MTSTASAASPSLHRFLITRPPLKRNETLRRRTPDADHTAGYACTM
jgi:hypothetical protein